MGIDMTIIYKIAEQSIHNLRAFRKPFTSTVELEIDRFSEEGGFYFVEGSYTIKDAFGTTAEAGRFKIKIESSSMVPVDIKISR
jgi:hypothetical protein